MFGILKAASGAGGDQGGHLGEGYQIRVDDQVVQELVVGTPVWIYTWRIIQNSLSDPAEMGSNLRLGILYLLSLGGVITVVTTSAMLVHTIISRIFGADWTTQNFVQRIGGPISVGVPLGMVWAYYGHWLNRHIESVVDSIRQAGMKRLYNYILSFIGLCCGWKRSRRDPMMFPGWPPRA